MLQYAALHCYHFVNLWQLLRQERLKPAVANDKKPLSMSQFRRLFNCARVPGLTKDTLTAYFKTGIFIISIYNNYLYMIKNY